MTADAEAPKPPPRLFCPVCVHRTFLQILLAVLGFAWPVHAATGIGDIWRQTHWGESSDALLRQFGGEAKRLSRALDFGDSYVDVVVPDRMIGEVSMVVFFQMDKITQGLKRI